MKWRERVSNTDVSCQNVNLLSNFDCLKSVSKLAKVQSASGKWISFSDLQVSGLAAGTKESRLQLDFRKTVICSIIYSMVCYVKPGSTVILAGYWILDIQMFWRYRQKQYCRSYSNGTYMIMKGKIIFLLSRSSRCNFKVIRWKISTVGATEMGQTSYEFKLQYIFVKVKSM